MDGSDHDASFPVVEQLEGLITLKWAMLSMHFTRSSHFTYSAGVLRRARIAPRPNWNRQLSQLNVNDTQIMIIVNNRGDYENDLLRTDLAFVALQVLN